MKYYFENTYVKYAKLMIFCYSVILFAVNWIFLFLAFNQPNGIIYKFYPVVFLNYVLILLWVVAYLSSFRFIFLLLRHNLIINKLKSSHPYLILDQHGIEIFNGKSMVKILRSEILHLSFFEWGNRSKVKSLILKCRKYGKKITYTIFIEGLETESREISQTKGLFAKFKTRIETVLKLTEIITTKYSEKFD